MRFGVDVVKLELNHWQPELGRGPRGGFAFDGGSTALGPTGSPDQFNAYAQFLLGLTNEAQKSVQFETLTGREWQYGIYFRDRWQVNKNLTINIGVRWEKYPLMTRKDRGIEYWDDKTNQVFLGGVGGIPKDLGVDVRHPKFLPRIGAAYRIGEDSVDPRRIRDHREPAAALAAAARLLPAHHQPGVRGAQHLHAVRVPRAGHPSLPRTRPEHGSGGPARHRRRGHPVLRPPEPRLHPVLEPGLRAPSARQTSRWPRATSAPSPRA